MAIKGFNSLVRLEKVKRTRVLSDEVKNKSAARVLGQIREGKVMVSEGKYRSFMASPDLLVERVFQAIKFGATAGEIQEACKDLLPEIRKSFDFTKAKVQIYEHASKCGVKDLSVVGQVLGLEDPGTRVVKSD